MDIHLCQYRGAFVDYLKEHEQGLPVPKKTTLRQDFKWVTHKPPTGPMPRRTRAGWADLGICLS